MTLGEKQREFTYMGALLVLHAYQLGYELTDGAAYRDPAWGVGHKRSLHGSRLARDYNLFLDGAFLKGEKARAGHNKLHDYWDMIGGNARIGEDLNHYSLGYQYFL